MPPGTAPPLVRGSAPTSLRNAAAFWFHSACGTVLLAYGWPPMMLPAALRMIVPGRKTVPCWHGRAAVSPGYVQLDPANPAASAFEAAAGTVGLRVFGLILWSAAITSVIGASYTSVSFLVGSSAAMERWRGTLVVGFIIASTLVFVFAGAAPVPLLIFAGAFNGLILPIGVGALLWVALRRRDLMDGYRYPRVLALLGAAAWLVTIYLGCESFGRLSQLLA